jgi:hypothetical protein
VLIPEFIFQYLSLNDQTANLMLSFSHFSALLLFTVICLLVCGRRFLFIQTIYLVSLDIILNVALKGTFKIPLSPLLHKIGYAFPSGHMQVSTVFYTWWVFFIASRAYWLICCTILIGVGAGLIHFGYHNLNDVIAGLCFGGGLTIGYKLLLSKDNAHTALWLFIIPSFLMFYNAYIYLPLPAYALLAYMANCLAILLILPTYTAASIARYSSWERY